MSQMHADEPNEDTNVIVASMKKRRRSMRLPILAGTLGLAGLVGIMMLGLGSSRNDSYALPKTAGAAQTGQAASTGPAEGEGQIEVRMVPAGQLWVDGKNHGSAAVHHFKLASGTHTLLCKRSGFTISQTFEVSPGAQLKIVFDKTQAQLGKP
jgi:hypothetical protein